VSHRVIIKPEAAALFSGWLAQQKGQSYGGGKSKSYGDASWINGAANLRASLAEAARARREVVPRKSLL
jgi:hypothetical protein